MSFGLGHGRTLDDAPGAVGVTKDEYPPMPDAALGDPERARLDPRAWFSDRTRPIELEIGSGKGTFLLGQAASTPGVNYLGVEWAREFYLYAADRVRRRGLPHVRMLHADATEFLRWRSPAGVFRAIHLYYSDPWPKSRHHKNRVIQHRFLGEVWRVLAPGGELRVVTDHDDLWAWCEDHFDAWSRPGGGHGPPEAPDPPFERLAFTPPAWVDEGETVGTNYERKMSVDRPPHAATLRKRTRVTE